ncbi:MAG: putative tRNA threonylcarbamoyladenosine biosynthesis protein Gcp [Parcubacteria group bacterium GW2011_GWA1_Parcubacteria_45_10]|nr:MAG: putative tRNA threonylcarbamoyladenosine biosynthesis protein Gcp [Parcubacteria group bacterium GW2011_GWA1_Parcubacteria_45_10]
MLIIGIETSCDETSVAFVEVKVPRQARDKTRNFQLRVLSNVVSSQVKLHAKFGGVVPVLAARKHSENIDKVFKLALKESGVSKKPDLIAVTKGPGLAPSLLIGVNFAKLFAWSINRPLIGVNHLEGHIYSYWLKPIREFSISLATPDLAKRDNSSARGGSPRARQLSKQIRFPAVVLIVSGGHTELMLMKNYGKYILLGQTLDDAAGECFDKVARLLNLGYPGGPVIDKLAKEGNQSRFIFPSPLINSKDYNFSFSGLKTSILYFLKGNGFNFSATKLSASQEQLRKDICASFENAAIKVLLKKTLRAAQEFNAKSILVGGGVAANSFLKAAFLKNSDAIFPERAYITDNAAMIAAAGFFAYQKNKKQNFNWREVKAEANLPLPVSRVKIKD